MRLDNIRAVSVGPDPSLLAPFNLDRRSFVRLVWGGPWYWPYGAPNRWHSTRAVRLPWFAGVFVSLRVGKALLYAGCGKVYTIDSTHRYARPADMGGVAATCSARMGWEPLS